MIGSVFSIDHSFEIKVMIELFVASINDPDCQLFLLIILLALLKNTTQPTNTRVVTNIYQEGAEGWQV